MSNIYTYYSVKQTQLEMIISRGYTVDKLERDLFNFQDDNTIDINAPPNLTKFYEFYYQSKDKQGKIYSPERILSRIYYKRDASGKAIGSILVTYEKREASSQTISVTAIKDFTDTIRKQRVTEAILIADAKLSSKAKEDIKSFTKLYDNINITVFKLDELTYNPVKHVSQAEYQLIDYKESVNLLREMKITRMKLPLLQITDPISKYYGFKIGDMIRVIRDDDELNLIATESINYRVVVGV